MQKQQYSGRRHAVKATYHIRIGEKYVSVRASHSEMLAMLALVAAFEARS